MVMSPGNNSSYQQILGNLGYSGGGGPQPNTLPSGSQPNTSMGGGPGVTQPRPMINPLPPNPNQFGPPPNINVQPNQPAQNVTGAQQPPAQQQPGQPGTGGQQQGGAPPAAPQGPNLQDQLQQFLSGQVLGGAQGPAGVPQFNPGQNPFLDQGTFQNQQNLVNNMLTNPSPYSSDLVQSQFKNFDQALQQQINSAKTGVNEDASRRGLFYGSTPEGQMGDINIQGNIARANMMNQLLQSQAQTLGGYEQAALGAAGGFEQQQAGAQQQAYNQQNQNLQNLLGYGQQQFNNQLQGAQFNQSQDALQQQLQLALMGA